MQLRCNSCHMPFTVSQEVVHSAIDTMTEKNWDHYDLRCPQCKKVNRVSQEQLLHAAPTWEHKAEE